jgi:hypothetical protein
MLSRKFTWWCFGGVFKIFFRGESLAVFGSGGLKGGVRYKDLPDPDLRYFSKFMAFSSVLKAQ